MPFAPTTLASVFSELSGFCIADPANLDRFHGGSAKGLDLVSLYTTTSAGDKVCASGVAIPVLGVEDGYYTINLAEGSNAANGREPIAVSEGWILEVISGELIVCGIGYLSRWEPNHRQVRRVSVPNGWYAITLSVFDNPEGDDDFILQVELTTAASMPKYSADPMRQLGAST